MHTSRIHKEKNTLSYHELAENHYKAGKAYLEQENYMAAIREFRSAIKLLENNNKIYNDKNVFSYQFISAETSQASENAKEKQIAIASTSPVAINERADADGRLLAYCRGNLGNAYYKKKRYTAALKEYQLAINQFEKLDERNDEDERYIASCHSNAEVIYSKKKNYLSAIKEDELAIAKLDKIHDKTDDDRRSLANNRNSIGTDYYFLDNYNVAIKEFELAEQELNNVAEIEVDDRRNLAAYYSNMGKVYADQNNDKVAIEKFELAIEIMEQIEKKEREDEERLVEYYKNLGEIYYKRYEGNLTKLNQLEKKLQYKETQVVDKKNEHQPVEMKREKSALLANSLHQQKKTKSSGVSVENKEAGKPTLGYKS